MKRAVSITLGPLQWAAAGVGAIGMFLIVLLEVGGNAILSFANWSAPALMGVLCLAGAILSVHKSRWMIWSPIVWFLAASALYYGWGALIYSFGSEESIS